jgi:hypothetical protein
MATLTDTTRPVIIPSLAQATAAETKARNLIGGKINGLTRAEIGIMAATEGGMSWYYLPNSAEYNDQYDVDTGRFTGATRRMTRKAFDKAIRSLWDKGLIRVEGWFDPRDRRSAAVDGRLVYAAGNSQIHLGADNSDAWESGYGDPQTTPQSIAGWLAAYLSGLTDKDPSTWTRYTTTAKVTVTWSPDLREAREFLSEYENIKHSHWVAERNAEQLATATIAEIVKPTPQDLYDAVSDAFAEATKSGDADVLTVWNALSNTINGLHGKARHGELPEGAMTPQEYGNGLLSLTAQIDAIRDWLSTIKGAK